MTDTQIIQFEFRFAGDDAFTSAMDKMAAAADQMAQKVNAAMAGIKPPSFGGGKPHEEVHKLGEKLKEVSEKAAGYAKNIGTQFGEGGAKLGEVAESAIGGLGRLSAALLTFHGAGATAAREFSAVAEAAEGMGEKAARTGLVALASRAAVAGGVVGGAVVAAGAAAACLVGYGAEQAEKYEKMRQSVRATFEEFRKLDAKGTELNLTFEQTASVVGTIQEGIRQGALATRQMAESWHLMTERVEYMRDRVQQMHVMQAEAAHQQQDRAEQSARAVESAERNVIRARQEYERHGRPMTKMEQADQAEQDRKQKLIDAEQALADARHKQDDEQRQAAERRQQQHIAEERALNMQARMEEQLKLQRRQGEEQMAPISRAFLQYAEQVKGIRNYEDALKDAAKAQEELDKAPIGEKYTVVLSMLDKMKESGISVSRVLNEAFGPEIAAKLERVEEGMTGLHKLATSRVTPEEKNIRSEEMNKRLLEMGEATKSVERRFQEMAVSAGAWILQMSDKLHPLLELLYDVAKAISNIIGLFTSAIELAGKLLAKIPGLPAGHPEMTATDQNKLQDWRRQHPNATPEETQKFLETLPSYKKKSEEDKEAQKQAIVTNENTAATKENTAAVKENTAQVGHAAAQALEIQHTASGDISVYRGASATENKQRQAQLAEWNSQHPNATPEERGRFMDTLSPGGAGGGQGTWSTSGGGVSIYRPPSAQEQAEKLGYTRPGGVFWQQPIMLRTIPSVVHRPGGDEIVPSRGGPVRGPGLGPHSELEQAGSKLAQTIEQIGDKIASVGDKLGSDVATGAGGGLISGPGSGTSDSIHIRASAGEYVMRAAAVSHLGRGFMDRLNAAPGYALGGLIDHMNSIELPRYAAGGMVHGPSGSAALHPVIINLPDGRSISGFHGEADAVAQLTRHAIMTQASSTGRKPSWVR
jgi:urease gamma subunit